MRTRILSSQEIELTWDIIDYLNGLVKRHDYAKMYEYLYKMGALGGALGGLLGNLAGNIFGPITGVGAQGGQNIGQSLGNLLPFKKGGRVKRTGPALVHKGEFVLPVGVKPTKAQIKKVAAKKRKAPKRRRR